MKNRNVTITFCLVIIIGGIAIYCYQYFNRAIPITAEIAKNATYDIPNFVTMSNYPLPGKLIDGKGVSNNHPISLSDGNISIKDVTGDGVADAVVKIDVDIGYAPDHNIQELEYKVTGKHHSIQTFMCNDDKDCE